MDRKIMALMLGMWLLAVACPAQHLPDPLSRRWQRQAALERSRIHALSAKIIAGRDSTQHAQAIYDWITHHVRVDRKAWRWQRLTDDRPLKALRRHKASPLGHAQLYEALCRAAGIEAVTIVGHAKPVDHVIGQPFYRGWHAWNAVLVQGKWILLDASWGSGQIVFRKQRLAAWRHRRFYSPYLPRFTIRQRPDASWWDVPPDSMVLTHLPAAPKWQLMDSTITLPAFETPEDTDIARRHIDFLGAIGATPLADVPERTTIDGHEALVANTRDTYDAMHGHVLQGLDALAQPSHAGGDTNTWKKGIQELDSARTLNTRWKRTVGKAIATRRSGLRRLEGRIKRACRQTRGESKLVNGELHRLRGHENQMNSSVKREYVDMGHVQRLIHHSTTDTRESGKPLKPEAQAKFGQMHRQALARIQTLTDSIYTHCKTLHGMMGRIYRVSDSLETMHAAIRQRCYQAVDSMMAYREQAFAQEIDTLIVESASTLRDRRSRVRQSGQFWGGWRRNSGLSLRTLSQFKVAAKNLENSVRRGVAEDSVAAWQAQLEQAFATWRDRRDIQLNIPLMLMDLHRSHLEISQIMLGNARAAADHIERLAMQYLRRQHRKALRVYAREFALAREHDARIAKGREVMRRWIAEARLTARQQAQRPR